MNKILNAGTGFWVLLWIQSIEEFLKSFMNSMKDSLNSRTILGTNSLQLDFSKMRRRNKFEFFHTISIKKIGKIPFPMLDGALIFYWWLKEVLFSVKSGFESVRNSKAFIQKEYLDFRVIRTLPQISSKLVPVYVNLELYEFRGTRGMLKSQGPMHLGLTEVLTKGALQMDFYHIHNQETKSYTHPLPNGRIFLSQSLKTLMKSGITHRLIRDPFDLLSGPPIKDKNRKTYRFLDGLLENRIVRMDREYLYQVIKDTIFRAVHKLLNSIGNHSKMRMKHLGFTLMSISLECFHKSGNNGFVDLWTTFFTHISGSDSVGQSLNQPIDYQSRIWYLKNQAKLHRNLTQRIPPFVGYG